MFQHTRARAHTHTHTYLPISAYIDTLTFETPPAPPKTEEFATLIQHPSPSNAGIEIQDPADWDPRGQYANLLDAVRKATKGSDARVYRVPYGGGARVEYWIVGTESSGKGGRVRLVGAKALAVVS